eukprot:1923144-Pyramimonas_sp.AAC.1
MLALANIFNSDGGSATLGLQGLLPTASGPLDLAGDWAVTGVAGSPSYRGIFAGGRPKFSGLGSVLGGGAFLVETSFAGGACVCL